MNEHAYILAYIHTHIYIYIHTHVHTYLHTCIKLCCGLFHKDRNIFQLDRSMGQDLTQADCSLWCMLLAMTGLSRWRPWGPGDMMGCRCGTTRSSLFAPCLNHKKLTVYQFGLALFLGSHNGYNKWLCWRFRLRSTEMWQLSLQGPVVAGGTGGCQFEGSRFFMRLWGCCRVAPGLSVVFIHNIGLYAC